MSASPSPSRAADAALPDARVIREAAQWLVRLGASDATDADREACDAWRRAHPSHDYAWRRAEQLRGTLGAVNPALAVPVLTRDTAAPRRAALKTLGTLGLIAPVAWMGWRTAPWSSWRADHATATGERQRIALDDGSTVLMGTRTALDVRFDADRRLLHLHEGEILVQTAPGRDPRPFVVDTRDGRMQALGTRFTVRRLADDQAPDGTRLVVLEHRVAVTPAGRSEPTRVVQHGEKLDFGGGAPDRLRAAVPQDEGWTQGVLYANDQTLGAFLGELARYRRGVVRCTPDAAALRVSGAFLLANTDRVLAILADTLPIRVRYRTRYWVDVDTRTAGT